MGSDAPAITKSLAEGLRNDNVAMVRRAAADGLDALGARSVAAMPELTEALSDADDDVQYAASKAILAIVQDIKRTATAYTRNQLLTYIDRADKAVAAISKLKGSNQQFNANALVREAEATRNIAAGRFFERITEFISRNYLWLLLLGYAPVMLAFWWGVVRIRPSAILVFNAWIEPMEIKLPDLLGGLKLSLRFVLLSAAFNYHRRVLDAWVGQHIEAATREFMAKPTVAARAHYIPMPVEIRYSHASVNTHAESTPEAVWKAFSTGRGCLVIQGQGGAGKTSLACQLALWALWQGGRLCRHRILPILIEEEPLAQKESADSLMEAARGQLQSMLGSEEPIPRELFRRLAQRQRVMVIVDHFSEMSANGRSTVHPADPSFSIYALIVTSRNQEELHGVSRTVVCPTMVRGDKLSSFIHKYLTARGVRESLSDKDFFDSCTRLFVASGKGHVTLLLARMFADLMVAAMRIPQESQEAPSALVNVLPDNVPDMMLAYVRELNRLPTDPYVDNVTLCSHLKAIAWECIWNGHCPAPALRENTHNAIAAPDAIARLEYLERRLQIIQSVDPGGTLVRFTLDPVAEYFAALYCCDTNGMDPRKWNEFTSEHVTMDPDRSRGFRFALKECCLLRCKQMDAIGSDPCILRDVVRRLDEYKSDETRTAA